MQTVSSITKLLANIYYQQTLEKTRLDFFVLTYQVLVISPVTTSEIQGGGGNIQNCS